MFPCFIEGGAHADLAWNQAARCPLCRPRRRGRRYGRLRGASDMRRRGRAEIAVVLDLADKRALSIQTLRGRTRALSQPAAGKGRRSCLPRALGEPAPQIFAPGKTFDGAGKPLDMFPAVPNAREQAAPASSPSRRASEAMGGTGVIDQLPGVFTRYIDSRLRPARRRGRVPGDRRWRRSTSRSPRSSGAGARTRTSSPGSSRRRCSSASSLT